MYDDKKSEKINVEWRDPYNQKHYPAGVAFREEFEGDYRLKIDMFPQSRRFYVRATSFSDNKETYKVEAYDGKKNYRTTVGQGHSTDTGSIKVKIPPYNHELLLRKVK